MMITRNNYEAFMLDYFEGNLPSDKIDELMLFLEDNSDLKENLVDFEEFTLVPESSIFEDKLNIKKIETVIHLNNYEQYFIAEIEGENTPEITKLLTVFLKENPSKKKEFEAYQKTKLVGPEIIFEGKNTLKKKTKVIPLFWWYSSAAAVILMMFIFKNLTVDNTRTYVPIADRVEKIKNNIVIDVENDVLDLITEKEKEESNYIDDKSSTKKETLPIKKRKLLKKKKQIIIPTKKVDQDILLAKEQINKEAKKDSIISNSTEEIVPEEVLYAESVKIVYEEGPKENFSEEKLEREDQKGFRIAKILAKSLADKKILTKKTNEEDEVVAFAFNLGKLGFSRNKKKNKN